MCKCTMKAEFLDFLEGLETDSMVCHKFITLSRFLGAFCRKCFRAWSLCLVTLVPNCLKNACETLNEFKKHQLVFLAILIPVHESAIEHFLVEVDVRLGGLTMVEALLGLLHDAGDFGVADFRGEVVEAHRLVNAPL